ncbi:MAG: alanine racemase [Oscillospiraceae bacterium]|jgi:alanine racemase|nr:alanine racemase [Oscillospiraceae bacterium]
MNTLRTWAECGEDALRSNIRAIRAKLGSSRLLGVVKANAYGHGAVRVSEILLSEGASGLATATPMEAIQLREAGITAPILVFGIAPAECAETLALQDVALTVADYESAASYSSVASKLGKTLTCHLKLDTGMGRLGFQTTSDAARALALPGLRFDGVFTHFAASDEPSGKEYTLAQLHRFNDMASKLERAAGKRFSLRHAANSGAVASCPESLLDMARPGIMLYGYPGNLGNFGLTPVMELKTRVAQVKTLSKGESVSYGRRYIAAGPIRVAVLPIGYADGLPRVLSGKLSVLINGRAAAQIGTICMDMCVVDVTDIPEARAGTVVTVFGKTPGFTAADLAAKCDTISYEILCGVSTRVPRVYV